ncbi:MAG: ABC transporter [Sphingomonas sp.]|uniref:ABC-type transport auxiliary lipoprotein family protein n=1 Tax=Sphingomonas sp. TaxID=28214 RepID=UPI00121E2055|nr:ABC-type transport auxiliary lipoprotein family protein [Sphingomonas sp.]THD38401.1 MAG: ABC transporter [Sphingomonas sp.]
MKRYLPLLLALPLAGCLGLGGKPPKALLTLTPTATLPVGATQSSASAKTVTIIVPVVPQALAVARIPVTTGDTVAYVTDAAWVEPPQRLFARLMSDTIAAKTGRVVLSTAQSYSDPGARLSGELRNFGFDGSTHEAVVTFDGALIRGGDANRVEKKRFEARVPVNPINYTTVGPALNQAANQVAGEVADWVGN